MAPADLHDALVLDQELYQDDEPAPGTRESVVRVAGVLPGPIKPAAIVRAYTGPPGSYREQLAITDPDGREVYRAPARRVTLTGQVTEDRFVSRVDDLVIHHSGEHTAHFEIDGEPAGSVRVTPEAAQGGDVRTAVEQTVASALKKGDILWVTVPGAGAPRTKREAKKGVRRDHSQAVWFVWEPPTVYVLDGPTEQQVRGLRRAREVWLTVRSKDVRSAIAEVPAEVAILPKDETWERIARSMLGERLNLLDDDEALARWREQCEIVALTCRFREQAEEPAHAQAPAQPAAAETPAAAAQAPAEAAQPTSAAQATPAADLDQETFDRLIAEGKPERVAKAKAKAAAAKKRKQAPSESEGSAQPQPDQSEGSAQPQPDQSEGSAQPQPAPDGVDQETYDRLLAEGHPERVALAKAKRAFIKQQRQGS